MTGREPTQGATGARLARLGVAAAVVSRVFGRLVGLVLVVVLARVADAETVALYGFLLGAVTLMTSVTDLGVASLAGRDVAARVATGPEALRVAVGPQLLSGGLAVVLTLALAVLAGPEGVDTAVLLPCAAFVLANALFNLWAEVLRGAGRVVLEGVLQGLAATLLVVAGSLAVLGGAGIVTLLWIVAAKEVAVLLLAAAVVRPTIGVARGLSFLAAVKRSLWLAAAGTALVLLWRQGMVLVGALAPTAVLADYVVATRLLDVTVTMAHTIGIGLFPALVTAARDTPGAARAQARRYALWLAAACVPLVALGWILAPLVTTGVFGEQWGGAIAAVRVLVVAAPVILIAYVLWFGLLAEGGERVLLWAALAGTGVAIPVTVVLLRAAPTALSGAVGTGLGALALAGVLVARLLVTGRRHSPEPAADPDPATLDPAAHAGQSAP